MHETERQERASARRMAHYLEPIVHWLEDDDVTEIYTTPDTCRVWLDTRSRGRRRTDVYLTPAQIRSFLNVVADRQAETLNRENEAIQAQLPTEIFGGARLQGVLPRVVKHPCINIRKRPAAIYTLSDYVAQGALTRAQRRAVERSVAAHENILVAGGTGSGKTTLVNAILKAMTDHDVGECFLIIEDTPELQCAAEDRKEFQTTLYLGMVDLVRISLRTSPDRIVIGEVRDGSAYHLMDAWTTGHPGGAGTVHATSARGALRRMARLARQAADIDHAVLVAEAIDLVIVIEKTPAGRRITDVARVASTLGPGGDYVLQDAVLQDAILEDAVLEGAVGARRMPHCGDGIP